ncbi:MAG: beta-Ig-H3/fasciclin, partial [Myxococcaceae bacterium]|nr:beta-Ig-H3/fasciclin [Myxococcaceae bacterium]
ALVNSLKGNDDGATTGINSLSSFRPDQMVPVIAYHVMTSRMLTRDIPTTLTSVDSLGGKLAVQRSDTIVAVDGIRVATTDIYASNGVIHVLDRVLLPSITDMVTTSAQFSALKNAVLAADFPASTRPKVAATLDGTTPYTLFAPSNAAFTALGALPEGQALTNQLLYHAGLEGAPIYAATLLGYTVPIQLDTALANRPLSVYAQGSDGGGIVKVADSTATPASVIVVNYFAGNGVIHVIDRVLIPAP